MAKVIRGATAFSNEDIVRYLLEQTDTLEPPTNAEQIAHFLELQVRGFFHSEYGLDPNIRAYLLPDNREIGVSKTLTPHRRKFSILHEVGHYVIPGHLDTLAQDELLLDDDRSLADYSVVAVEMEANRFAADCIFQLDRLQTDVDNVDLEWRNILEAATIYDASVIATARRWVEGSLADCALLLFVPVILNNRVNLRYSYAITSESFRQQYFDRLSGFTLDENTTSLQAFRNTNGNAGLVERLVVRIGNQDHEFKMMLFSTKYNVYGLIVM